MAHTLVALVPVVPAAAENRVIGGRRGGRGPCLRRKRCAQSVEIDGSVDVDDGREDVEARGEQSCNEVEEAHIGGWRIDEVELWVNGEA
jgi:hypothetical protein